METNSNSVAALTPQEIALQKSKSAAERKFELVIADAAQIASQCRAIVITDSTTFGMANQILSKANSALKLAEERRKEIIRPYQDYINFVNDLVKSKISNVLSEEITNGKNKIREWNDAETKRANDLKAEDTKRFTFLKSCEASIQKQVERADTAEACDKLIGIINAQWPADEKFGNYVAEAIITKNNFISLLSTKKVALAGALNNNLAVVTESIAQITEVSANQSVISEGLSEKKEIVQASIQAETSSVRRTWKWEVDNEAALPREFLSVDKKKVDEYMKANKGKFDPAGTIKGGIRFFQDAAPVIK